MNFDGSLTVIFIFLLLMLVIGVVGDCGERRDCIKIKEVCLKHHKPKECEKICEKLNAK